MGKKTRVQFSSQASPEASVRLAQTPHSSRTPFRQLNVLTTGAAVLQQVGGCRQLPAPAAGTCPTHPAAAHPGPHAWPAAAVQPRRHAAALHTPGKPSAAAAAAAGDDRVKVVVRIRPPSEREAAEPACLQHTGVDTLTLLSSSEPSYFTLDHVAGAASTQHQMFKVVGRPIVENALAGFNSTIFAYGQTGSGKVRGWAGGLAGWQ